MFCGKLWGVAQALEMCIIYLLWVTIINSGHLYFFSDNMVIIMVLKYKFHNNFEGGLWIYLLVLVYTYRV